MDSISRDKLLPRVVHRSYFDAAGVADLDREPHRFGIVRPLGNDVYAFLAHVDDELIRNVHPEHLEKLKLTIDAAWETATSNLRTIAFDGKTIKQTITKANDGRDWSVWLGNEFTASTTLLPELLEWSRENLNGESFLVRIASTQSVFILQKSHAAEIPDFDNYIAKVLEGSNNLVSDRWFMLSASGLEPFTSR